jgi:hypothetical protein
MVVLCNRRLGPSTELLLSNEVAALMLRAAAAAARPVAEVRWELELAAWLDACADGAPATLDMADIAWTPDHFEAQRRFLVLAIQRAAEASGHLAAFEHWRRIVEAHPSDSVQVGRLWQPMPTA